MNVIDDLQEKQSLWAYLRQTKKPIVLYGMGDGALKIMEVLKYYNIPLSGIFASDGFVRGHSFAGFPVRSLAETEAEFGDFIILLAFGVFRPEWMDIIRGLNDRFELYAPDVPAVLDVPIAGWCCEKGSLFDWDYLRAHEPEFIQADELLADELSRRTFRNVLDFKISGKIRYLDAVTCTKESIYQTLICPSTEEVYVDLGAYNGDTILEFLEFSGGQYRKIFAVEPDRKNYNKLLKRIEENRLEHVEARHLGSYSRADTLYFAAKAGRNSALAREGAVPVAVDRVDNLLNGNPCTIIKFDVEGAEEHALKGCAETIRAYRPKLMLSAYHKNSDLFRLPLLVKQLNPDYQIYLRHLPYFPAWETNFYCI